MSLAKQLVEAEIGQPGDLEGFVSGALQSDFLLQRLQLGDEQYVYPSVKDTKTGTIVAYLRQTLAGDQRLFSISTGDTFSAWKWLLGDEYPRPTSEEAAMLEKCKFDNWRSAVAFMLSFQGAREALSRILGISECERGIPALRYMEKLERIVQTLAARDFLTEKIDRRSGKGESCYVIGRSNAITPEEAVETLRVAAAHAYVPVVDAKAARRNESTWQVDFKAPGLFEDDTDEFVQTAFREEVPGQAELERAAALRDALRSVGLPTYRVEVCDHRNAANVARRDGWTVLLQKNIEPKTEFTIYWDNRLTHLSKGKSVELVKAAVAKIGGTPEFSPLAVHGRGSMRYVRMWLPSVGVPPKLGQVIMAENEMDDFVDLAAAKHGTIGDELRLKRLVNFLKSNGFRISKADLWQQETMGGKLQNYYVVNYTIKGLWSPQLPVVPGEACAFIQKMVQDYMNNVDREITGLEVLPLSAIKVWPAVDHYNVRFPLISLRKPGQEGDDTFERTLNIESVFGTSDMDDYGEIAQHGIKSRMLLAEIRKKLEARGYVVRVVKGVYPNKTGVMRVMAWFNKQTVNGETPDYSAAYKAFTYALKDAGAETVHDNKVYAAPNFDQGDREDQINYRLGFWIARCWVKSPEPEVVWDGDIYEAVSFDDLGIGEHERLAGIVRLVEERDIRTKVIFAHAEPYSEGVTMIRVRAECMYPATLLACLGSALKTMGIETVENGKLPGLGPNSSKSIVNRYIAEVYALVPSCGNLYSTVTVKGSYPLDNFDHPDRPIEVGEPWWNRDNEHEIGESLDPSDEMWLRGVADKWPGVRDLERLKDVVRKFEAAGIKVNGVSQSKVTMHHRTDDPAALAVAISVLLGPGEFNNNSARFAQAREMVRVLDEYDVKNLNWKYDTLDEKFRVYEWIWYSHNSPEDIVPFVLRKGQWDEYVAAGHLADEVDMFLVEQFEEPEPDSPNTQFMHDFSSDIVDPYWRERLRLKVIARDLHELGWGGYLTLVGKTIHSHAPDLRFVVWRRKDAPEVPHVDTQFKEDMREINKHVPFTAPSRLHAELYPTPRARRMYTDPAHNNWQERPRDPAKRSPEMLAYQVEVPYMWGHKISPELTKDTPVKDSTTTVIIGESTDAVQGYMGDFERVAVEPYQDFGRLQRLVDLIRAKLPFVERISANLNATGRAGGIAKYALIGMAIYLKKPTEPGVTRYTVSINKRDETGKAIVAALKEVGYGDYAYVEWRHKTQKNAVTVYTSSLGNYAGDDPDDSWGLTAEVFRVQNLQPQPDDIRVVSETFDPSDMEQFANVANKPYEPVQAVQDALRAMIEAFKAYYPGYQAAAAVVPHSVKRAGGIRRFDMFLRATIPDNDFHPLNLVDTRNKALAFRDVVKAAVNNSKLAKYRPKGQTADEWPVVQDIQMTPGYVFHVSFELRSAYDFKTIEVPDVLAEALNLDRFVQGAIPGINDQARLKAFTDELATLHCVKGAKVNAFKVPSQVIDGKRQPGVQIRINVYPKINSLEYCNNWDSYLGGQVASLLNKHGFGPFEYNDWTMIHGVGINVSTFNSQEYWHVICRHGNVSTTKFPETTYTAGEIVESDDMAQFVGAAIPDIEDQARLKRLLDDLLTSTGGIQGGWLVADGNDSTYSGARPTATVNIKAVAADGVLVNANVSKAIQATIDAIQRVYGIEAEARRGIGCTVLAAAIHFDKENRDGWSIDIFRLPTICTELPETRYTFGQLGDFEVDESEDPEEFVQGALPWLDDQTRFHNLMRDIQAMDQVSGIRAIAFPNKGSNVRFEDPTMDIDMYVYPSLNTQAYVMQNVGLMGSRIAMLLTKHGFGPCSYANYGTRRFVSVNVDQTHGISRWKVFCGDVDAKVADFPEFEYRGGVTDESLDPGEFVQGADQASQYGLYNSLQQIAQVLKNKGWIGYIQARAWHGGGTWHDVSFSIASKGPGEPSVKEWEKAVYADIKEAIKGLHIPNDDPLHISFQRQQLPGYEQDYQGFYHWKASIMLDMVGRIPFDLINNHAYRIYCDIESGEIDRPIVG